MFDAAAGTNHLRRQVVSVGCRAVVCAQRLLQGALRTGGEGNPLGARAMYLGTTVYRIHGTNQPKTIGHAVSSGCFRLVNRDVIDLYARVPVGTKVVVRQAAQP